MPLQINYEKCIGCGQCANICPIAIKMINNSPVVSEDDGFGCVGCGQCAMVCSAGCITVKSKTLDSDKDLFVLPPKSGCASYQALHDLMLRRRSVRNYLNQEVDRETVEKIMDAAKTAPIAAAVSGSDVNVLVLHGKEKTQKLAFDCIGVLEKFKFLLSDRLWSAVRGLLGENPEKTNLGFFRFMVKYAIKSKYENNLDCVLYGAPVALVFYGRKGAMAANVPIACTYAMLAAESLGLHTCMIESMSPILTSSKKLRKAYGIAPDAKNILILICGYPCVDFKYGVKRTFASVESFE